MLGTWHQPLVVQRVEHVIHRRQRLQLAQLIVNELLKVETSRRTDIALSRPLFQTLGHTLLLGLRDCF